MPKDKIPDVPWLQQEGNVITILTDLFTLRQMSHALDWDLKIKPLNSTEAGKLAREANEYALWSSDLAKILSTALGIKIEANIHNAATVQLRHGARLLYCEVFGNLQYERGFQLRWWLIWIKE